MKNSQLEELADVVTVEFRSCLSVDLVSFWGIDAYETENPPTGRCPLPDSCQRTLPGGRPWNAWRKRAVQSNGEF